MIAEKLAAEGIHLKNYNVGEHKVTCPECSASRKKKNIPCLSVKIDEEGGAVWCCHHCQYSGNIPAFERKKDWTSPEVPAQPTKPPSMYEWFERRGISNQTVDKAGCYTDTHYFSDIQAEKSCVAFPYADGGKIENIKYRTKDKNFAQSKGGKRTLYNIDNVTGDEVIIVEGEMDVLSLMECGIYHAVSLPDGAPQKVKYQDDDKRFLALRNCAGRLQHVKKVIIAVDNDEAGEALKQELAHRFGKDRCWCVKWPEEVKDANGALNAYGADEVKSLLTEAEPWPIDGVYRFQDYKDSILALYRGEGPQPLTLGMGGLDDHYKIMPGTFHVVTGIPNHGKSNFLEQILMKMAKGHGWKFGIFTPEHRLEQYGSRLLEKASELPFHEGPSMRMTENELLDSLSFVSSHFYYISPKDHTPTIDWILERAKFSCLKYGIKGLVIDPYNEIEASKDKNQSETDFISQMISKIKRFAQHHGVTVWVVAHPAKMPKDADGKSFVPDLYSISGSAHWYNKADMGLVVYRNFEENYTAVHVAKVKEVPAWGSVGKVTFYYDGSQRIYKQSGAF